jgi:hypothetical protein
MKAQFSFEGSICYQIDVLNTKGIHIYQLTIDSDLQSDRSESYERVVVCISIAAA